LAVKGTASKIAFKSVSIETILGRPKIENGGSSG